MVSAARVCADMAYRSMCVCWLWFSAARVCADMVYCSTCVCRYVYELTRPALWHEWVDYKLLCFLGCPLSPKILLGNEMCMQMAVKSYMYVHGARCGGWVADYLT